MKILGGIANLEPGKNAQLAVKKISEKYKKRKYKILGEIVKIEEVQTPQGKVKVPVSAEKTAKKVIKKYNKIGVKINSKRLWTLTKKEKKKKQKKLMS